MEANGAMTSPRRQCDLESPARPSFVSRLQTTFSMTTPHRGSPPDLVI
jgi:hypothetical protein